MREWPCLYLALDNFLWGDRSQTYIYTLPDITLEYTGRYGNFYHMHVTCHVYSTNIACTGVCAVQHSPPLLFTLDNTLSRAGTCTCRSKFSSPCATGNVLYHFPWHQWVDLGYTSEISQYSTTLVLLGFMVHIVWLSWIVFALQLVWLKIWAVLLTAMVKPCPWLCPPRQAVQYYVHSIT